MSCALRCWEVAIISIALKGVVQLTSQNLFWLKKRRGGHVTCPPLKSLFMALVLCRLNRQANLRRTIHIDQVRFHLTTAEVTTRRSRLSVTQSNDETDVSACRGR